MAADLTAPRQYQRLEERLTLLAWLNAKLGYASNDAMLKDLAPRGDFTAATGRSPLYDYLANEHDATVIAADDLARYDDNIRRHLAAMNAGRPRPLTLRYFQYLAALYTEICLDNFFNRRAAYLAALNDFVKGRNARRETWQAQDAPFSAADITKLAFWMATGSGKTLLLHLNYRQFLHYNTAPLDNILLITPPGEALSQQHITELTASGIPARRFDANDGGLTDADTVRVLEISKLVGEKRGAGVTVPVEQFEGNNLIFVDEGHKGSGGDKWLNYRKALAETGFTFEYSATFGQALSAARDDKLTAEYGKAIAFDYSYRYFHRDGYGKDFRILNVKQETTQEQTDTLLLGNLLAFYEQLRAFEDDPAALRPYNIERPLWIFVGSSVNAVYTEDKEKRSDVHTVVRFFHRALQNKQGWAVKTIDKLLRRKSGLSAPDGSDLFDGRFPLLRERMEQEGLKPADLYADILRRVFRADGPGGLGLYSIRAGNGELGLRASTSQSYFGLIYVGDAPEFRKRIEEDKAAGITVAEDAVSPPLFDRIDAADTTIDVLIGAKRFIEGWSSWRVSAMGLLNVGKQEGPQIIQLFGRGVRLQGKGFTLKRSRAGDAAPQHLRLLETLNIFAVRANSMQPFLEYVKKEGVETEGIEPLPLLALLREDLEDERLVIPRVPDECPFAAEVALLLEPDKQVTARVDLSLKAELIQSGGGTVHQVRVSSGRGQRIPDASLALVDWQAAYLAALAYAERRGYRNLIVRPDAAHAILTQNKPAGVPHYELIADDDVVRPKTLADVARLQEAVAAVLRKYVDEFYRIRREAYEASKMRYVLLTPDDPNLTMNRELFATKERGGGYLVKVKRSDPQLVETVRKLISDAKRVYQTEAGALPRIYFDRHLYLPLLLEQTDAIDATPPPLNASEARFVRDLKAYWQAEQNGALAGRRLYLLRNQSRGYGVGFFEGRNFYPDFILWVLSERGQRIIFIEPHGMLHELPYANDPKARLHEELPAIAEKIAANSEFKQVTLDAYIVSATPYARLQPRYNDGTWLRADFTAHHILFPERDEEYDYMKILFG